MNIILVYIINGPTTHKKNKEKMSEGEFVHNLYLIVIPVAFGQLHYVIKK